MSFDMKKNNKQDLINKLEEIVDKVVKENQPLIEQNKYYDDIEKAYAVRDSLKSHDNFEFITLKNSDDIYPEFKKVFRKKHAK